MGNDLRLEIYPDSTGAATGSLYLDDGETLRYEQDEKASTHVSFTYGADGSFSASTTNADYAAFPNVATVAIYGVETSPQSVKMGDADVSHVYEASTKSLFVVLGDQTTAV